MHHTYKNLSIYAISFRYVVLCNSKNVKVYNLEGDIVNEFKASDWVYTSLYKDTLFVSRHNKNDLLSVDILHGTKETISFKNDIDHIKGMVSINDKLIIDAMYYTFDEKQIAGTKDCIIVYDIIQKKYNKITLSHQMVHKIFTYKNDTYIITSFKGLKTQNHYTIYRLDKGELIEYTEQKLKYFLESFNMSYDKKYFMMIDGLKKISLKVFDIEKKKEIFSLELCCNENTQYHMNLGNVFYIGKKAYVYVYKTVHIKQGFGKVQSIEKTLIYDLETKELYKEFDNLWYDIYNITPSLLLYSVTKCNIARRTTKTFFTNEHNIIK